MLSTQMAVAILYRHRMLDIHVQETQTSISFLHTNGHFHSIRKDSSLFPVYTDRNPVYVHRIFVLYTETAFLYPVQDDGNSDCVHRDSSLYPEYTPRILFAVRLTQVAEQCTCVHWCCR